MHDETILGRVAMTTDGRIVSVIMGEPWYTTMGEQMATDKRNVVEINLQGAEIGTATVMQMADALQADTVKLAEQARQLRANAHEVALILADARAHILPKGRVIRTDQPTPLETAVYRDELDRSVIEGAERLLEALQGVQNDSLGSLVEWRDGYVSARPVRRKASLPENMPDHLRRGITVSGAFLQPQHDDTPHGDGDTLRLRVKYDPGTPPAWFNLATIVLLARIGARAIMAVTNPSDVSDDDGDWPD